MAINELSNSKSICVLGVVICCFAILWPKIFLPMLQSTLSMTSSQPNQKKDDMLIPPRVREAMRLSETYQYQRIPGRPQFQKESKMTTSDQNNYKQFSGGLMGLVMPLYTIGVIVFFVYTIFKMLFKNKSEENGKTNENPIYDNYRKDFEYKKFMSNDENDIRVTTKQMTKRKADFDNKTERNAYKRNKIITNFDKEKGK
ncbi:resistance to inhibitors of cholinesterase protein 3-like [Oppia nitens]|uniref:resistance to inhibitors of cholinesterase protein 3-like n=1 Tax=Oppia nitens TaxID=1686743 RepID=UPI0023DCC544|nr:resistance to inhibitors of cholinesterase protein 3-like [Oppia nitens]